MKSPVLEKYLIDRDISIHKFSKMCGFSYAYMHHVLAGYSEPRKSSIDRILKVTGLTYEECFCEGDRLEWQERRNEYAGKN